MRLKQCVIFLNKFLEKYLLKKIKNQPAKFTFRNSKEILGFRKLFFLGIRKSFCISYFIPWLHSQENDDEQLSGWRLNLQIFDSHERNSAGLSISEHFAFRR